MPVLSPSGQDGVSIFTVMALSDILTRATRQSTGDGSSLCSIGMPVGGLEPEHRARLFLRIVGQTKQEQASIRTKQSREKYPVSKKQGTICPVSLYF